MAEATEADRRFARRAIGLATLLVTGPSLLIGGLALRADGTGLSRFSRSLGLEVDLADCATGFARMMAGGTALSIALGAVCFVLAAFCFGDIYAYKRTFKTYRTILLTAVIFTAFLLLPLVMDGGTWPSGGRRNRIRLAEACRASHDVTFLRLYLMLLATVAIGWVISLLLLLLRRQIALGRDPFALSDDPERRRRQLVAQARQARETKTLVVMLRLGGCVVATLVFGLFTASLKVTMTRLYHQVTWVEQPTRVYASGAECIFEIDSRGVWREQSRIDCPTDASRDAFSRSAASRAAGKKWRVLVRPNAQVEYESPSKERIMLKLSDFFVPEPKPVGSEIVLLRDPANPRNIDHVFDTREVMKAVLRLAIMAASATAIFFLWPGLRSRKF